MCEGKLDPIEERLLQALGCAAREHLSIRQLSIDSESFDELDQGQGQDLILFLGPLGNVVITRSSEVP